MKSNLLLNSVIIFRIIFISLIIYIFRYFFIFLDYLYLLNYLAFILKNIFDFISLPFLRILLRGLPKYLDFLEY